MNNTFKSISPEDLKPDKLVYLPINSKDFVENNLSLMTDYLLAHFSHQKKFEGLIALNSAAKLIINSKLETYCELNIKQVRQDNSIKDWATTILKSYQRQAIAVWHKQEKMTAKQLACFLNYYPRQALCTRKSYTLWVASQLLTIDGNEIAINYLAPELVELFARKGLPRLTKRKKLTPLLLHQLITYLYNSMNYVDTPQLATSTVIQLIDDNYAKLIKTDKVKMNILRNWIHNI